MSIMWVQPVFAALYAVQPPTLSIKSK